MCVTLRVGEEETQSGCHSSNDARLAPLLAALPQPEQAGPGSAGQEQERHAPHPVLVARRDRDVLAYPKNFQHVARALENKVLFSLEAIWFQ